MDADSLKGFSWLIVWGGLFYLMMRYGCGAHMMGGHNSNGHADAAPGGEVKDPVCGRTVDPRSAAAAAVREGSTHYFCSVSCRNKFEQAPEQYVGASAPGGHQQGGHHNG